MCLCKFSSPFSFSQAFLLSLENYLNSEAKSGMRWRRTRVLYRNIVFSSSTDDFMKLMDVTNYNITFSFIVVKTERSTFTTICHACCIYLVPTLPHRTATATVTQDSHNNQV